ncbi:MAG: hypothetical protein ABIP93_17470 [Gemmatimonadaceae bacterium]
MERLHALRVPFLTRRRFPAPHSMRYSLVLLALLGLLSSPAPAQQVAELPRATVATSYPAGGRAVRVSATANLQAALDAARPGDVLLLAPGATYVGNFLLRNKGALAANAPAGGWIVIRTDVADAALGGEGARMTPTRAASLRLARILSPDYNPAVGTNPGAHHYRLTGLEIASTPAATTMNMLVRFGEDGQQQNAPEKFPHHLVVDRSYVHGNPKLDMKRCVVLNGNHSAVIDSWLSECHGNSGDSQAVLSYNSAGPLKIQNNHLEAGHEMVVFGGSDPSIAGLSPADIEVRGNHLTRPNAWKKKWQVKNLLETKNVRRLVVEGNVMENNWSDAQDGFALVLKSENQDGTAPWSTSSDITVRDNRIRGTGSGFNLSGTGSNGNKVVTAARLLITNNLVERINVGQYTGEGIAFQLLNGISDAVITHNTVVNQNATQSTVVFDGAPAQRLVMHSNVFFNGVYGVHGSNSSSGNGTLASHAPGALFRRNAIIGASCAEYPPGTVCPSDVMSVGFTAALVGDFRIGRGPLKARGHDGGDIGADIDQIERATRGAVVAP